MTYPDQTLALLERGERSALDPNHPDRAAEWWIEAVQTWEGIQKQRERHSKGPHKADRFRAGSRWLSLDFDPYKVCSGAGSAGLPCADPWCSEKGVVAPGHDRH